MTRTVGADEARTHFHELVRAAAAGEEILITRRGKPVGRLVPPGWVAEAEPGEPELSR